MLPQLEWKFYDVIWVGVLLITSALYAMLSVIDDNKSLSFLFAGLVIHKVADFYSKWKEQWKKKGWGNQPAAMCWWHDDLMLTMNDYHIATATVCRSGRWSRRKSLTLCVCTDNLLTVITDYWHGGLFCYCCVSAPVLLCQSTRSYQWLYDDITTWHCLPLLCHYSPLIIIGG